MNRSANSPIFVENTPFSNSAQERMDQQPRVLAPSEDIKQIFGPSRDQQQDNFEYGGGQGYASADGSSGYLQDSGSRSYDKRSADYSQRDGPRSYDQRPADYDGQYDQRGLDYQARDGSRYQRSGDYNSPDGYGSPDGSRPYDGYEAQEGAHLS